MNQHLSIVRWCIILLVFPFIFSCKKKQEKLHPVEEKITESVYASGIVKSKDQYQVFSSANGVIAQILVSEGDLVRKGDALIRLTNTTAQLNTENARISVEYAAVAANKEKLNELQYSISLAKAKMNNDATLLERQRNLWNQQIGTRNELDARELAYKSSLNNYESAKLRYTELQKQISFQEKQARKNFQISSAVSDDYTIKSQVNGRIYNILKEKGEMVNTQTPVAVIGNATTFYLELQVDEYDIARLKQGQKVILNMDSYKGQVFEALVYKINPIMNERSKSFTVEATFVKQPEALYPNLTCEANIVILQKEKAITIPRNYLLSGDSVLMESKEKKKVVTGLKDYQKVEIVSGLTINDIILKPAS